MRLHGLDINRLPGIKPGFSLADVGPGINVIHGPNGSGKSSVLRAIRALLYPDPATDGSVDLQANLSIENKPWTVVRSGDQAQWSQADLPCEPPLLPDARYWPCYGIHLESLIEAGATESDIEALAARELAGGYDLRALALQPQFNLKSNHGRPAARQLSDATRSLRIIQDEHAGIRRDEARIDTLRGERADCEQAIQTAEHLRANLRWLERRRARESLQAQLANFPPDMARLRGDELDRINKFRETKQSLHNQILDLRSRLEQVRGEAASIAPGVHADPAQQLSESSLAAQGETLERLRACERDLKLAQERVSELEVEQICARTELGSETPAAAPRIDPHTLSMVEERLQKKRSLESEVSALEAHLSITELAPGETLDSLRDGRVALLDWTSAARTTGFSGWRLGLLASSFLCVLAVIAVAGTSIHPAFWLLLLPVIAIAILLYGPQANAASGRTVAVARFTHTGLSPPSAWTAAAVANELERLDEAVQVATDINYQNKRRTETENRLAQSRKDLDAELRELTALAEEVGFNPLRLDASFQRWLRLVSELDRAQSALQKAQRAARDTRDTRDRLREALHIFFSRHEAAPDVMRIDADQLARRLEALRLNLRALEAAQRVAAQIERERVRAAQDNQLIDLDIDAIYAGVAVAKGDDRELQDRLRQLEAWSKLTAERERARGAEQEAQLSLSSQPIVHLADTHTAQSGRAEKSPDALSSLEDADIESLNQRLSDSVRQGERLPDLERELTAIETRVGEARKKRALEIARAARDDARDRLHDDLDQALFATAGGLLLADVGREHRARHEPAVLRDAGAWLQRFTLNNYELRYRDAHSDPQGGTPRAATSSDSGFSAFDTRAGEHRRLGDLSSGTRAQLLLALRLAFMAQAEAGRVSLPLFLDEALSTADPLRYRAVVESVRTIAADGQRQVFYLTSQAGELRYWSDGDDAVTPLDLGAIRGAGVPDAFELQLPAPQLPPSIDGHSPESYGELLGVQRIDPWGNSHAVHLFHLLREDLMLLEKLLSFGVNSAGTARSILASRTRRTLLSESEAVALLCRLDALDAWLAAWCEGRGRPLNRPAIEACPAISATYQDRIWALAETIDGDGRALLEAIDARKAEAVKGFRGDKREELEEWLLEHGHLDPRGPLVSQQILHRVLGSLAADIESGRTDPAAVRRLVASLDAGLNLAARSDALR